MAIPHDNIIKDIILKHLYTKKNHNFSISSQDMYQELIDEEWYGTEDLTFEETNVKYQQSASLWANRVQWKIKHLKDEGLLLPTNKSGHGIWQLSPNGVIEARRRWLEMTDGEDLYLNSIELAIKNDVEIFESEVELGREGQVKEVLSSKYERNLKLRTKAIDIHGLICKACSFDFHQTYGNLGKDFIEVHHLIPISNFKVEHDVNPFTDMTVLCANCHRMIHRSRNAILSIEDLQKIIKKTK
jgi:hypothetical protein